MLKDQYSVKAKYKHKRIMQPSLFEKESFRDIPVSHLKPEVQKEFHTRPGQRAIVGKLQSTGKSGRIPQAILTPKKNPIYNKLSKKEHEYIDMIIGYVNTKFKIRLSHDEGIELYILLKHHANDWKREGIKQTQELEIAVMKDYFDDLKRGHKKLQLKQNPSDLSLKKIEEGGAVGMTIKTPGGNVKIRNFKSRVEGMDDKGNVISQGIYEIVINPEKYAYEADGARPVGVDFVKKLLANGEVIAETKMKIVRDNPNAPAIDLWEKERAEAEKLPNGILVMRYDSASNLPTDGPSRASLKMWLPKAYKPFVNYYYTGRNIEEARDKRDKSMKNYSANYDTRMNKKNKNKQERKGSAADYAMVKPGDIYYSSWGYDQTNIDFYQIISVKGAYAMIREIKSRQLPDETGNSMAAYVMPVKDSFTNDPEFKKKIQFNTFTTSDHSKTPYFHILHGQYASPWNRDKIYSSWYA